MNIANYLRAIFTKMHLFGMLYGRKVSTNCEKKKYLFILLAKPLPIGYLWTEQFQQ